MELLEIPLIGNTKESELPTPEEFTYWKDRKNRTFYIDYEINEDYSLVELAKIIIQMNIEEKKLNISFFPKVNLQFVTGRQFILL